jgi:hypothetical protein
MTSRVQNIAEQVKALPVEEREELLSWLADLELGRPDNWDEEIAHDSGPSGRMGQVLDRVRQDIAQGRTKLLPD